MLKILGMCLVMAGCAGSGWYLSERKLHRIRLLEEWDRLLQLLYGEIEYAGSDMPELIRHIVRQSRYSRNFWSRLEQGLCMEYPERFRNLWQRELSHPEWKIMEQEERLILAELGEIMGQTDRQTQLQSLQLSRERLKAIQKRAGEAYQGQAKVYHVTGITAGCFLLILLL